MASHPVNRDSHLFLNLSSLQPTTFHEKNLQLLYTALLLILFSLNAHAQTEIIDPNIGLPVCPGVTTVYSVRTTTSNNNLNGCAFNWVIQGGVVSGTSQTTSIGSSVAVTWDNLPTSTSNVTRLSVTLSQCSNTSVNSSPQLPIVVRSLSTTTPTAITVNGSSSGVLGLCDTAPITLATTRVQFPFPAGTTPAFADQYEWTIPSGWLWPDGTTSTGAPRPRSTPTARRGPCTSPCRATNRCG